ncbi:hypothetical protein J5X84_31440 [Streptosporangiaceae bacterium NEAU-GS5]|nr:hypothetical protein [Streptosporangiaceae bacterium NEAU-GS5]
MTSEDAGIGPVGALTEELRRRMFDFVRRARRPVTRDEAAASAGISRKLAAFHLDKLVEVGLLRARYEPPDGVRKVGRQPKVYEASGLQIQVTIPERRHELLAGMLMRAIVTERDDESATDAAMRVAGERGHELGEADRDHATPSRADADSGLSNRGLSICERMLDEHGFEPIREGPSLVRLRNCPFHPLAAEAPDLVCGMNLAFLSEYLQAMRIAEVRATLVPRAGECCVELSTNDQVP